MPRIDTQLKPQHGPVVPDPAWEQAGISPAGHQLFIERFKTNRAVPDIQPPTEAEIALAKAEGREPRGERRWKRHPVNGEPLYPMNKRRIVDVERMFFIQSQGNFNQEKVFYTPPTPEELKEAARRQRAGEIQDLLFGSLADSGLTNEEILARVLQDGPVMARSDYEEKYGEAQEVATPDGTGPEPGPDEDKEYPFSLPGVGRWELSNGTVYTGKKVEAQAMEAQVVEARAEAEENPSY